MRRGRLKNYLNFHPARLGVLAFEGFDLPLSVGGRGRKSFKRKKNSKIPFLPNGILARFVFGTKIAYLEVM